MRDCFLESTGQIVQEAAVTGTKTENGFAEAEDAVGGGFEGLGGGIVRIASNDDLQRMIREKRGGDAVGSGEEAVLRGDAGEGFERFLGEGTVAVVAGEGVHSNQGDGGDGIRAGSWGILKGLAADGQAGHGGGGG